MIMLIFCGLVCAGSPSGSRSAISLAERRMCKTGSFVSAAWLSAAELSYRSFGPADLMQLHV